ncbi:hypothetical protein [Streptomyces flaveolus]|uniref:hypothetical protein n=1 Tax=Streptomyces flaveolus TaxID=67297 RepID=UPI003422EB2C
MGAPQPALGAVPFAAASLEGQEAPQVTDAELVLIAELMGFAAPFVALYLTLCWLDRQEKRKARRRR